MRYTICFYFKSGQHVHIEKALFNRIAMNYVGVSIATRQAESFLASFPDAVSQAVMFCMFLAYPKSRGEGDSDVLI
jgi:hypothetical protein